LNTKCAYALSEFLWKQKQNKKMLFKPTEMEKLFSQGSQIENYEMTTLN